MWNQKTAIEAVTISLNVTLPLMAKNYYTIKLSHLIEL
jgi:hypothetical protein